MVQAITPALEAILKEKLQVGAKAFRGEIEVDYVIPGSSEIGETVDLNLLFGSCSNDPTNTGTRPDWTDPQFVNDGSDITTSYIIWTSHSAGSPGFHSVISDLGSAATVSRHEILLSDGGTNQPSFLDHSDDGVAWTPAVGTWSAKGVPTGGFRTFTLTAPIAKRYWRTGKLFTSIHPRLDFKTWRIFGEAIEVTPASHGTVTFRVASLSVDKSRKMAAAQLDALLDNEDRTRGYYQQSTAVLVPNNPIRAYAWYGSRANRVRIFTGNIDRVHEGRDPGRISLKARSRTKWLLTQGFKATAPQAAGEDGAVRTEANGVYLNRSPEYIVADILDRAGWSAADRDLAATGITIPEYDLSDGSSWLEQIAGTDRLTTVAGFDFVEDELGVANFKANALVSPTEPNPDYTFEDGVDVLQLDHEADDEGLATRVEVTGPMTSGVGIWDELWETSKLKYPAGIWYDPDDTTHIRVVDRVTRYLYRLRLSDRVIVSKAYIGGVVPYPLGLSGDPLDDTIYWVLSAPWRNTGSTTGNALKKMLKADNSLVASYPLPNGRWSGMKSDGTNIWLSNYDDGRIYKRSLTGTPVDDFAIVYGGVTQDQATGLWIDGTTIGMFFADHERFLLADTSDPETITGIQKTTGTHIAGGEKNTTTHDTLYADASAGDFGNSSGYVWGFDLIDEVTNDVSAIAADQELEDALGFQSGIADRVHDLHPEDDPHPFEIRLTKLSLKVVDSLAQAQDVAAAQLVLLSRIRKVLDLVAVGNPALQINDVARYVAPRSSIDAPWLVDSYRQRLTGDGTFITSFSALPWEAAA